VPYCNSSDTGISYYVRRRPIGPANIWRRFNRNNISSSYGKFFAAFRLSFYVPLTSGSCWLCNNNSSSFFLEESFVLSGFFSIQSCILIRSCFPCGVGWVAVSGWLHPGPGWLSSRIRIPDSTVKEKVVCKRLKLCKCLRTCSYVRVKSHRLRWWHFGTILGWSSRPPAFYSRLSILCCLYCCPVLKFELVDIFTICGAAFYSIPIRSFSDFRIFSLKLCKCLKLHEGLFLCKQNLWQLKIFVSKLEKGTGITRKYCNYKFLLLKKINLCNRIEILKNWHWIPDWGDGIPNPQRRPAKRTLTLSGLCLLRWPSIALRLNFISKPVKTKKERTQCGTLKMLNDIDSCCDVILKLSLWQVPVPLSRRRTAGWWRWPRAPR
jgi:hypothetical protein